MELFQKITLILSLFAIISSFFSVVINIYLKKSVDVKLNQYELISEEQNRILKNLFDLEDYLTLLLRRYGGDATQLKEEITPEEKDEANKFIGVSTLRNL